MYDLDELKAFTTVMETHSLTQGARQLGVSKSTLSRRISQLEARLGQPLLRRQSNRLLPTEAGLLFLSFSQQILRLAEQSRQMLDDLSEEVSGELIACVHGVVARGWFAQRMEEFLIRHPGIRLELHTLRQPPATPQESTLCLWLGEAPECGLRQETLGRMARGIYAHPDYLARHGAPHHPRELASHAWIDLLGETCSGLRLYHELEGEYDVQPPASRLRVDQEVLQADAIVRGQGLGLLPEWLVAQRLRAHPGTLVRCLEEWRPTDQPVLLLYPFGRLPRKMTSLLEHLRQAVPDTWRHHVSHIRTPSLMRDHERTCQQ
ncbi:MAG: LysR family transcriptional regulator [Halomonas sp.]|nr:LysR family transcriptional regulator [Halomonas sp.]